MRKYRGGEGLEFIGFILSMGLIFIIYKILINIVSN